MGIAFAALAGVINNILKDNEPITNVKSELMPNLVDAGKILCGVFHMMTTNRKYYIESQLHPTVKKVKRESKPDEFLCEKNFAEKSKEIKTQWRTGREMKSTFSNRTKSSIDIYYSGLS